MTDKQIVFLAGDYMLGAGFYDYEDFVLFGVYRAVVDITNAMMKKYNHRNRKGDAIQMMVDDGLIEKVSDYEIRDDGSTYGRNDDW